MIVYSTVYKSPCQEEKIFDRFLKVWSLPYLKINPKKILRIYFYLFCWLVQRQSCKQTQHQNSHTKQDDESVDYCIHMDIILLFITLCNTMNNIFLPLHRDQIECNVAGLFLLVNRSLSLPAFERNLCHIFP